MLYKMYCYCEVVLERYSTNAAVTICLGWFWYQLKIN